MRLLLLGRRSETTLSRSASLTSAGEVIWALVNVSLVTGARRPAVTPYPGAIQDITERKQGELGDPGAGGGLPLGHTSSASGRAAPSTGSSRPTGSLGIARRHLLSTISGSRWVRRLIGGTTGSIRSIGSGSSRAWMPRSPGVRSPGRPNIASAELMELMRWCRIERRGP